MSSQALRPILTGCQSLGDLERFAMRHHAALNQTLRVELRRPPTDSTFRYLFLQVDGAEICRQLQVWMLAQIPDGATGLDQLVCDSKTLRSSIVATDGGGGALIAQVTLDSKALGAAIAQATYDTRENHQRAALRESLSTMDLEGALIQSDALHTQKTYLGSSQSRGRFPLDGVGDAFREAVSKPTGTLHRQISKQFLYSRKIPFTATVSEHGRRCETTWIHRAKQAPDFITEAWPSSNWIFELVCSCKRAAEPFLQRQFFLTSQRNIPKALLQLVRDRWCIESWHWHRGFQLHEDGHRYGGPGAAALATLRTLAPN